MQRNTLWTIAAAATVAGALATLPSSPVTAGVPAGTSVYRCYKASALKGATGNLPVHFTGSDEFGPFNVTIAKARSYCTQATPSDQNFTLLVGSLVCFATKDLERPALSSGAVVNVSVDRVGRLGLKLRKSKLTCLPAFPPILK